MLGRLIGAVLGLVPWDARHEEVDDLLGAPVHLGQPWGAGPRRGEPPAFT